MEQIFKYIVDQTAKGDIKKETAIEMIKMIKQNEIREADDIAIIGMAGMMPLADSVDEFWENVQSGIDCISDFPESRNKDIYNYLRYLHTPEESIRFVPHGFLEQIDKFDHQFFRLSIKEAGLMDPAQRMFLETAWCAIEDAGYGGNRIVGTQTGVYAGFASNMRDLFQKQIQDVAPQDVGLSIIGNLTAMLPSRISYLLDLKGPTMTTDTACSSGLVSVYQACEALQNGKCEMALAGAVNINTLPVQNDSYRMGIESSDMRTRAFDNNSDGSAIGEGVAVVLLKPLKKALADGDNIHAVIKGVAINQDGKSVGLTAPNPAAQTNVIIKAWEDAKIDPETIAYIETHGTGTRLGDPIEIKGITDAFRQYTLKNQFCAISSAKTNIGHAEEAAGIISLVKLVMALKHKKMPPSLNFGRPNNTIAFQDSPVYVNTILRDWERGETPRRAGVSSFGISGTNCHIVLEEAPVVVSEEVANQAFHVLSLSAGSDLMLKELVESYLGLLNQHADLSLRDVCFTAHTGRGHHNHRLAIVFQDRADLLQKLIRFSRDEASEGVYSDHFRVIANNKEKRHDFEITENEKAALDRMGSGQLEKVLADTTMNVQLLQELSRLYAQGADLPWDKLYEGEKRLKVSLPKYPFERTRCWFTIPETSVEHVNEKTEVDWFYAMDWIERPREEEAKQAVQFKHVLLFKDQQGIADRLAERLRAEHATIISIEFGNEFKQLEEGGFILTGVPEDYDRLLSTIPKHELSHLIHLGTILDQAEIETFEQLQESQKRGVYSMFYLLKAMIKHGIDSKGINAFLISQYLADVTEGQPRVHPEGAPLVGIGKNISQEHPGIRCRGIDIDEKIDVDDLLHEFAVDTQLYTTAYRNGKRYVEEFKEFALEDKPEAKLEIRKEGVYVITGGTGGIGLELARDLAEKNQVHLVLIARKQMPAREEWDAILELGEQVKHCRFIKAVRNIESMGSTVDFYASNTADFARMEEIITDVRARYGPIRGVIHAAGVPGDGFLFMKEREQFDIVLHPKVYGTWIIDHLTRQDKPDFFLMFSSGLSLLSEPGHGDYTAANSYLDSFALYRDKKDLKTLAVNWTTWREAGMAVDHDFVHETIFKTISTADGIRHLYQALDRKLSRALIGEFNYLPEFLFLIDRIPFLMGGELRKNCERLRSQQQPKKKERPTATKSTGEVVLSGKDDGEFSSIELRVAQVYKELLGYGEIDINDSFFELGGDSVMLNHMLVLFEKEYPGAVKLIDLFTHTSVATLSAHITSKVEPMPEEAPPVQVQPEGLALNVLEDLLSDLEKGDISLDDALGKLS